MTVKQDIHNVSKSPESRAGRLVFERVCFLLPYPHHFMHDTFVARDRVSRFSVIFFVWVIFVDLFPADAD